MHVFAVRSALLCAFLCPPILCIAQSVHENVSVDLVNVYMTATDSKGHFVTDLKPSEIELTDDGVKQEITHFTNFAQDDPGQFGEKGVPLTVAFVIDTSASMGDTIAGQVKIDIVRSAALRLVDELREEDRMMLIAFNEYPEEVTPLTSDHKRFDQDLLFQSIKESNTALLDSIYFAMEKMKDVWGRKIIVVCSDGEDTASYLRFDEVMSNLVASDITVLAFGTMALNTNSMRGRYILEKLATASGGYAFFPTDLKTLDQVMAQLRAGMRSQYSLGYRPSRDPEPGSWHKIAVKPLRAGMKLRYREGYFAK